MSNYVDAVRAITPEIISQIEERKNKLDRHWDEYNDLQTQLEMLDDAEVGDRIAFEHITIYQPKCEKY